MHNGVDCPSINTELITVENLNLSGTDGPIAIEMISVTSTDSLITGNRRGQIDAFSRGEHTLKSRHKEKITMAKILEKMQEM